MRVEIRCQFCGAKFYADRRRMYCSKVCGSLARSERKKKQHKWKSYAEIKEENRRRKVEDGWRGRKMQGSGILSRPGI